MGNSDFVARDPSARFAVTLRTCAESAQGRKSLQAAFF